MRNALAMALGLFLLGGASPCAAQSLFEPETPSAEDLVQVDLVSEPAQAVPGQTLWLGVRFKLAPHWHLYWLNPGDSGVPPELTLTLPEGLEAKGAWRFPAPERLVLDGGLLNYVHEGELTLVREVAVSPDLQPGAELEVRVEAEYLVCKEICLAGAGSATTTLTVGQAKGTGDGAPAAGEAKSGPVAAARARWPRVPGKDLPLTVRWEETTLVFALEGATRLTWFPLTPALPQPEGMVEGGVAAGPRLEITYPEPLPAVSGVLVAVVGDRTHYLAVEKAAD